MLLLALGCSPDSPEVPAPRPPDVLLVVLDTTRSDALSAYGNPRPTSPQLEAVARAGVRFADVTSPAPWTWPVHASLFTGEEPWRHGAHSAADPEAPEGGARLQLTAVDPSLPTLAERFTAAGYTAVSISANRLIVPELGLTRGFEHAVFDPEDDEVVRQAGSAMAGVDGPLLLFVNLMGAHQPWAVWPVSWVDQQVLARPSLAPAVRKGRLRFANREAANALSVEEQFVAGQLPLSPADLQALRGVYEGEVAKVDHRLNALLTAWKASGRSGVVAITADHGEAIGEHGQIGHHHQLYDELVQVPLVLAGEGVPVGEVVDTPVGLTRLHDTLLELAGLDGPDSLLRPEARPRPVLSAVWPEAGWKESLGDGWGQGSRFYREEDLAVLYRDDGSLELYDLATDPDMLVDLAGARPEEAAALQARAREAFGVEVTGPLVDRRSDALEQLRALGYAQ